jgi:hypothetical protein
MANYTDTVVLKNGDNITGNVKGLAQGQLSLDTDAMGTVVIEWDKIAEVLSDKTMQVETISTDRYFGKLVEPSGNGEVVVRTETGIKAIANDNIVHVTPIDGSFWQRIQGSLSSGFSFTKSSDVAQYSIDAEAVYRTRRRQVALELNTIVTRQDSGTTEQLDTGIEYKGFRNNGWFGLGLISFQRNQQLGIDGRGLFGLGAGRNVLQTSKSVLAVSAGLDLNVEDTTSGEQRSGEAFGTLQYFLYKYRGDQTNLLLDATIFPSLTDSGRFRYQYRLKFRQELLSNIFWGLTLYGTADNQPPAGALADNDYGVITSLGWTFGP